MIVCEKETHLNKPLLDKIKKGADAGLPPEDLFSKVSTKEDWQLEVTKQLEAGNESLAKNTYLNHLVTNKEEQEQEYEAFVSALHAKANPPVAPKLEKNQRHSLFEEKKESRAKIAGIAQEKVLLHSSKPLATKEAPPKEKPMENLKKKAETPEEKILFEATRKLQDALNHKKDLKLFFRELLTFFGEQSAKLAIKEHPLDFEKWGALRNSDKEHIWCSFTGLYSQYEKMNSTLLSKLQKHLKTMKYNKKRFFRSELRIPGKTCCGRKTLLNIEILPGEDKEQWSFTMGNDSEYRRIIVLCGINTAVLTDAEVTKQFDYLIKDKIAMAGLKGQSITDYNKIKLYHLNRLIYEMQQFKNHRKTDFVMATVLMEINGKMHPLTQYFTWMNRTLVDDPVDYMTGGSTVFLIHQDYSLIDTVLEDIASLFKEVIEWDGTDLQTLINKMTFINYEFAHAMPFKEGSKDIGKWLEKLLYRYHELELKKKADTGTQMDMFTYSLEEYSKIYCSDLAFEKTPQYSQPFENKEVPIGQSSVINPLVIHAPITAPTPNLSSFLVNNLFKDFNEVNFMNLMRQKKADIKPLHEIIYKIADKETSLLEFIEENPGRKALFLKWVSNNLFILAKINLETPNISNPTPFMQDLNQLAPIQEFLKLSDLEHEQFKELISKTPAQELLKVYSQSTRKKDLENYHIPYLQVLTSMGADLKDDYKKFFHLAASLGEIEALLFLYEHHFDLSEPNRDGLTVAHFAAQSNCLEILTWINDNPKLKHLLGQKSNSGITPAYILAEKGFCYALEELNKWGLDLNVPVEFLGMKPVHVAASNGHLEVLQLFQSLELLEEPTDFEHADKITPLMFGALAGKIEVVRFLLGVGVEVDKTCSISCENILHLLKDCPPGIPNKIMTQFERARKMHYLGPNNTMSWNARAMAMIIGHEDVGLLIREAQKNKQVSNHNKPSPLGNQQVMSQQQGQCPQKITDARPLFFNNVQTSSTPLNAPGIDFKV